MTSCYGRLRLLKSAHARDIFEQELASARDEMKFQLIGYVVTPEHVHLLMSEPLHGTPSTVFAESKIACITADAPAEKVRQGKTTRVAVPGGW
jgi:hypothetical protein